MWIPCYIILLGIGLALCWKLEVSETQQNLNTHENRNIKQNISYLKLNILHKKADVEYIVRYNIDVEKR